jgi:hypothetical protein
VPVEFLTDEQRRLYGRFHGEPTLEDLARYFHLDDSDRSLIALHRGDHNRLGFAVQLCAVRYVGAFPEDLAETPAAVVSILGRQLSIEHPNCFAEYCTSRQRWDHTVEIRERGGYVEFSDGKRIGKIGNILRNIFRVAPKIDESGGADVRTSGHMDCRSPDRQSHQDAAFGIGPWLWIVDQRTLESEQSPADDRK